MGSNERVDRAEFGESTTLRTSLCDLLGIEYPIMQAGMGHLARGALAAAVSEAGGLGVVGSAHLSLDEFRNEIRLAKSLTDKPVGIDILFAKVSDTDRESTEYTREVESQVEIALEERVSVLVSGLGNPGGVIDDAHSAGMRVMSIVGNSKQAERMASEGVDAIIASGHEAGGHVGRIGTAVLVPQVVDAVDVPVVAAGGLVDGRGLVAALAFGAMGVWMGTRFVATREAYAHENYKNKIVEINEEGTVVTRAHSGKPCRIIRNKFTQEWEGREAEIEPFPRQFIKVGQPATVIGRMEGDVENGSLPCGQGAGGIHGVKGAGDVVLDIVDEARSALEGLCRVGR